MDTPPSHAESTCLGPMCLALCSIEKGLVFTLCFLYILMHAHVVVSGSYLMYTQKGSNANFCFPSILTCSYAYTTLSLSIKHNIYLINLCVQLLLFLPIFMHCIYYLHARTSQSFLILFSQFLLPLVS